MLKHFKSFLSEQTMLYMIEEVEKHTVLKHLPHVEDHPLIHGDAGFGHAYDTLMHAHNHIKSGGYSSDLTTKYDGSPSVVFGTHPDTKQFFVASKSAFNKTPKINYTHADIEKNHGNSPGLAEKLHAALDHLSKVTPKGKVYQGDIMYSDTDLEHRRNGNVSFTPNTIRYTASGDLADKIKKSKLGVVVHQQYEGDSSDSLKVSPHPDVHNFKNHKDVWVKSPETDTKNVKYSDTAQQEYQRHMDTALAIHNKHHKKMYDLTMPHQGESNFLVSYINSTVRTGELPHPDGLMKHIENKYKKEIDKLKTPAAKEKKQNELQENLKHIDDNSEQYHNLLRMHHHLKQAKNVLVDTLNKGKGELEHDIDGNPTHPEGYVINHEGHSSKLVNREEFSRANFARNDLRKSK